MMIKVSGGFLDFDGDVDVERQVKLFENIDETWGDFSYSFELAKTSNNMRLLGYPMPDNISKQTYQRIEASVLNESGEILYNGYLRVERISEVLQLSFFSGNNNWFGLLSNSVKDIDFSEYDTDLSEIVIQNAIFNTEGIVFPLIDHGTLNTRGNAQLVIEDFVAGIYVKDVFSRIFRDNGIKVQGELFNDVNYLNAITVSNGKSQDDIDAASSYAQNTSGTSRPVENDFYKMDFQNDSVYPFYDGSLDAFDLANSMWVAPFKTEIEITITATFAIASPSYSQRIYIYINGAFTFVDIGLDVGVGGLYNAAYVGSESSMTMTRRFLVEEGDTIEVYTQWQQSGGSTQNDIVSGTVKITPVFIYKIFGNAVVPNWTQQQYVSNILRLFNCLTFYNESTKTLTINLFDNIKSKPAVDISMNIDSVDAIDYTEVIQDYAKNNLLSFQEIDVDDDFRETRFSYSKGVIQIENEFVQDEVDILESEFANPISYINTIFDMSIEKTNLLSLERSTSTNATGVTDSSGVRARFAIEDDIFLISDLVRIEDSTNPDYNGDWKIYTLGAGYVEFAGLQFSSNATARLTKLNFKYTDADDVFIMRHIPLYSVSNFSGLSEFRLENTNLSTMSLAFFHLLNTGRQINRDFIFSFSFSTGGSDLQYQISLIDQYFVMLKRILEDPVKLICTAYIPNHIYKNISFLNPVSIKTMETTNMYYVNRITGYKESYLPCTIELIKLP